MPEIIEPVGLCLERQWYIYQNLCSLVSDISKADIVAPLPTQELASKKRKAKVNVETDAEQGPSSSKSRKEVTRKNT